MSSFFHILYWVVICQSNYFSFKGNFLGAAFKIFSIGIHSTSWICDLIFIKFGNFLALTSSNNSLLLLSPFYFRTKGHVWCVSHSVVSTSLWPHGRYVAHQGPPSMEFSRQEYWSGLPFPSPGDLPDPGIKPGSPALQADALPSEPPGKPTCMTVFSLSLMSLSLIFFILLSPCDWSWLFY